LQNREGQKLWGVKKKMGVWYSKKQKFNQRLTKPKKWARNSGKLVPKGGGTSKKKKNLGKKKVLDSTRPAGNREKKAG